MRLSRYVIRSNNALSKVKPFQVQLALLTAVVKLFIYKSSSETAKTLVHKTLKWATEEIDNPDLRDRGFMYWRMLAMNPTVAAEIVLAEKPPITTDSDRMDRGALDQLLLHTGTLGSIYHKNPEVSARAQVICCRLMCATDFYSKRSRKSIGGQPCIEC